MLNVVFNKLPTARPIYGQVGNIIGAWRLRRTVTYWPFKRARAVRFRCPVGSYFAEFLLTLYALFGIIPLVSVLCIFLCSWIRPTPFLASTPSNGVFSPFSWASGVSCVYKPPSWLGRCAENFKPRGSNLSIFGSYSDTVLTDAIWITGVILVLWSEAFDADGAARRFWRIWGSNPEKKLSISVVADFSLIVYFSKFLLFVLFVLSHCLMLSCFINYTI